MHIKSKFYWCEGSVAHNSQIIIKCLVLFLVNFLNQLTLTELLLIFVELLYP